MYVMQAEVQEIFADGLCMLSFILVLPSENSHWQGGKIGSLYSLMEHICCADEFYQTFSAATAKPKAPIKKITGECRKIYQDETGSN